MKYHRGFIIALSAVMCLQLLAAAVPAELFKWIVFKHQDVRSAMAEASEEDKLIFVDVYATWCTACKLMEESSFRSAEVVDLVNAHYVPLKLNIESVEGKLFAVQENIQTLPALLILNEKGERLAKVDKALQAGPLAKLLKSHIPSVSGQRKSN